jgi:flagellar protein FlaG
MVDSITGSSAADAALSAVYPTQAARGATSGSSGAAGGAASAGTVAATSAAASLSAANTIDADVSAEIDEYLRASGHEMKFDIDGTTKQVVVKVYNSATGELVRQIPDAELLHLAQALRAGNHTLEASA